MSSTRTSSRKRASEGDTLVIGGAALFAVICCAAPILAVTVGLGGVLSLLASPWILAPIALVIVGVFTWYLKR